MTDGPFGSKLKTNDYVEAGIRVVRLGNIGVGTFRDEDRVFVSPEKYAELQRHEVKPGDLVIAALAEPVGRATVVPAHCCPAIVKADCVRFKPATGLDAHYLMYALNSPGGAKRAEQMSHGVGRLRINMRDMRVVPVPVAPTNEQGRIVAKLDELFSKLDAGVAALGRVRENLKKYRASVLKAAVEGRLTEQWRAENPDVEPASVLLERILVERRKRWEDEQLRKYDEKGKKPPKGWREKYKEPVGPDLKGLPELPRNWAWIRAEQICVFITKGTTPKRSELFAGEGDIPFIRVQNLTTTGLIDHTVEPTFISKKAHAAGAMKRSTVFPGDVLMNIVGPPLGKVGLVSSTYPESNVNQAIAILRPVAGYLPEFLAQVLATEAIIERAKRRAKATAGQFNLTLAIVRDLLVPLPPYEEQLAIVDELSRQLSVVESTKSQTGAGYVRAAGLRQSILKSAFNGKLVPQDPTDERAGALLDRIRIEREEKESAPAQKKRRKRTPKKEVRTS